MDRMIAFCGLVCTDCPAYQATQADDDAARERVAALWREEYCAAGLKGSDINCDGCIGGGRLYAGHCLTCNIRVCGVEHGVANCGHCAEYETCEKIAGFFRMVPAARTVLDGARAAL